MQFLGIEIGQAATRVLALDVENAAVTASATARHQWISGLPEGRVEQDPRNWIAAVDRGVREVLQVLGEQRSQVAGIGITAEVGGMVVLDAGDQLVRPAKLVGDRAADPQAERIAKAFGGAPGVTEMLGNGISSSSMAAQFLWLKEEEPERYSQVRRVMTAEDFIGYWLSGEAGTTASSAADTGLFTVPERAWCRSLVEFIGPEIADLLPAGLDPAKPRGRLRKGLADSWGLGEKVWVAPGGGHQAAAIFAAGLGLPGDMTADLSSAGALIALSEGTRVDFRGEGTVGCDLAGNGFTRMAQRNASAAPELVRHHNGWSSAEFGHALSGAEPGAGGLLMLPYLKGESVPRLPGAAGLLHGITESNFTPENLAMASAEGVALGYGYALSRLRDLGYDPREVRLTRDAGSAGGQLLADVLGISVVVVSGGGGALLGSAMQAMAVWFREQGEAIGFDEVAGYIVAADEETRRVPNADRHAFYQELMGRQQYLAEILHEGGFM